MCLPHVSTVVTLANNGRWAHINVKLLHINNEMILICILPVRVKEQPKYLPLQGHAH